jgi:starch synthase
MPNLASLRVLIVSAEVAPFAKTGGLGDVAGSLPKALRARGVDARVVFPKYAGIKETLLAGYKNIATFDTHLSWRTQTAVVGTVKDTDGAPIYMIDNPFYFGRDSFYGFGDDYERFAFFARAAVEMLTYINFQADVIHFNDWQTGLGCTYLRDIFRGFTFYQNTKSLFTIHNLHYQGVFGREVLWAVGLNDGYFTNQSLEYFNNISFLKAGIIHSNAVSTVSQTYAQEIQTSGYGYGMDGLLRGRGSEGRLFGIINGIDIEQNDPATDPRIFTHFDHKRVHLKKENKHNLQAELKLPIGDMPLIGIVSRLVEQKGFDIISIALEELLHKDVQVVVLGTGEGRYENLFRSWAWRMPHKLSANITFDDYLAQRIYAACDIFLVPSVYEPCGLTQLFAMRYGAVPVVRKTGGLADTVRHYHPETREGNGFLFEDYVASALMWALNAALYYYGTDDWPVIIQNAMEGDFSWEHSAEEYIHLYRKLAQF